MSNHVQIAGEEFVNKLLEGERDFSGIRLEPYFDLSGHERFPSIREVFTDERLKENPVLLNDADLTGINADFLHLPFLKANNVCFKHATLMRVNFESSEMRSANFRYARLQQADLERCDLRNADMRQADLYLANLTECELTDADVAGAVLFYTDMRSANIKGIANLIQARSVETANFQFVALSEKERNVIRMELWAQEGKKRRLFGGAG